MGDGASTLYRDYKFSVRTVRDMRALQGHFESNRISGDTHNSNGNRRSQNANVVLSLINECHISLLFGDFHEAN
jgi:hypothetical protein